jgi:hypothetical protein
VERAHRADLRRHASRDARRARARGKSRLSGQGAARRRGSLRGYGHGVRSAGTSPPVTCFRRDGSRVWRRGCSPPGRRGKRGCACLPE